MATPPPTEHSRPIPHSENFSRFWWPLLGFAFFAGGGLGLILAGELGWSGGDAFFLQVVLAMLANGGMLAIVVWLWERVNRNRLLREQLQRDLRYFRLWEGEEAVLRKTGLIHDLNALGAVPPNLEEAVLTGAALHGADLRGCNLRGARLEGADLQGALLAGADLWGANLTGANLAMARLDGASLRGCNLENASLAKAELAEASLHRANLVNANLAGTDLRRARLELARFAAFEEGDFQQTVHSSVEDWIREGLDAKGYFSPRTSN